MNLKIYDILEIFPDFMILSGDRAIDNEIKAVKKIEKLHIKNFDIDREFILLSNDELINNIDILEKNIGILGIKAESKEDIPDEIMELAKDYNYPIIYIPETYDFNYISNTILNKILDKQEEYLSISENIHNIFNDLIVNGRDIDSIIENLKNILGFDIAFLDIEFDRIYIASDDDEFIYNISIKDFKSIEKLYYSKEVKNNESIYGYFILNKEVSIILDNIEKIALENASLVVKLEMQNRISNRLLEEKNRDEFIKDLLFNNIETIEEIAIRGKYFDWNIKNGLSCIIIDIDNYKDKLINNIDIDLLNTEREKIYNISKVTIKNTFSKAYYTLYSDKLIFLLEYTDKDNEDYYLNMEKVIEVIKTRVEKDTELSITIGIGSYIEDILEVHKSYIEAQKAIALGRKIYGNNGVYKHSELGIYKILYDIALSKDGNKFYNDYLKKLIESDKNNDTEYILTMEEIIANGWNLKETSKKMLLHYNTILYRFNKISELQNDDYKNQESKFKMQLALKIREIKSIDI